MSLTYVKAETMKNWEDAAIENWKFICAEAEDKALVSLLWL